MAQLQIENLSLGTVYRNLAQLTKEHMILELNINGISHYDGNLDPHQHFVCNECGSIFDCHTQNKLNVDNIKETNEFNIQEIDMIFSGLCQHCQPN